MREDISLNSPEVAQLEAGTMVSVLEVVLVPGTARAVCARFARGLRRATGQWAVWRH